MQTILPNDLKLNIIDEVKRLFNTSIEDDIIDFVQDFQSRVAVEEGFAKKDTVRFYNLAVFMYNPKKVDSKDCMIRLLKKHNGNRELALKEFKELGKIINLDRKALKKYKKENKVSRVTNHAVAKSVCGKFSAR